MTERSVPFFRESPPNAVGAQDDRGRRRAPAMRRLPVLAGMVFIAALAAQSLCGCRESVFELPPKGPLTESIYVPAAPAIVKASGMNTRAAAGKLLPRPDASTGGGPVKIDYPLEGSVFPPDLCAPTILWHDESPGVAGWLVDVSFEDAPHHIYALTDGTRPAPVIDAACVKPDKSNVYIETPYQASSKAWTPGEALWDLIKANATAGTARIALLGYGLDKSASPPVLSRGSVSFSVSKDPVGAPIFYRDVPLMPSIGVDGTIAPLAKSMLPLIKWSLRDVSKPAPKTVMSKIDTCANCHSFSSDGKILGMDLDGPDGDKGAYLMASVQPKMVVDSKDVFTWNSFSEIPKDEPTFGLFPRVSPDGRYCLTMVLEKTFVQNYADYSFLQSFYPTTGILVYRNQETGEIKRLPGADDPDYVQANPAWTPDGQTVFFLRAKAVPAFGPGPRPKTANDPEETPMQYDIWQVPFNDGKGGEAKPLEGASNNGKSNSMPQVSPDGRWLVYVQCKRGMLMRPDSRLFIVPVEGGPAREMTCNLPLMNSWHSWSPNSRWLVFSSKSNRPFTQIFLTHVDENGNDTPAILIPNSTADNRAVNIPEFVNIPPDGIQDISTPAIDYRRRLGEAVALRETGQYEEALEKASESLRLKESFDRTNFEMGWLLENLGKSNEAVRYYMRAIALNKNHADAHRNLGYILYTQQLYEKSAHHCAEALRINPDDELALANMGHVLLAQRKFDAAIEYYSKVSIVNPKKRHEMLNNIGNALIQQGSQDEGIGYLRQAIAAKGDFVLPRLTLANVLSGQGKSADVVKELTELLKIDPNHAMAHNNLGYEYFKLGRYDEATAQYAEALRIDPGMRLAQENLANLLQVQPDNARAREILESARRAAGR